MIRCNNCGRIYAGDDELSRILDIQEIDKSDGKFHTVDRCLYESGQRLNITDSHYEEVFKGCGSCCNDDFLMDIDKDSGGFTDEQVEEIWAILEDVPLDCSDCTESEWFGFLAGTPKFHIWEWFDEHYSKGVSALVK